MSLAAIQELLKNTMGLDAHTVGTSSIQRAAQERMQVTGHGEDLQAYFQHLRHSRSELDALIEAVVVPETWFFRDRRPFEALQRFVKEEWLPKHFGDTLRVLSVPCSSGEEAYSVAMALCDIGFPEQHLHIDAIDISAVNLDRARRGRYRANSFRGQELGFRDRYFTARGDEYQLDERILHQVHLQQDNLVHAGFLHGVQPYDVVFCRNLLIYFDRATQDRALGVLRRLLKNDGILFIGHAEAGLFLESWLASNRYPSAFAFRKQADDRRAEERPDFAAPRKRTPRRAPAAPPVRKKPSPLTAAPAPEPARTFQHAVAQTVPAGRLDEALRLANHGHLAEAADLCERHLRESGPAAQAFYLLGLVREAAGQSEEAEQYWRKTLYLEPRHLEALTHLALLCERNGDSHNARLLRQRAERAGRDGGGGER